MGQGQRQEKIARTLKFGIVLLLSLSLGGCGKEKLSYYTTKDGRFNAWMPCSPSVKDMQMGGGRLAKIYTCKVKGGEYGVLVARLPAVGNPQLAQQAMLEGVQT